MGLSPRTSSGSSKIKPKPECKEYFKQMLKKQNIKQFEIEVIGDASQKFVEALVPAMQSTVKSLLKNEVASDVQKIEEDDESNLLAPLSRYNWSYQYQNEDGSVVVLLDDLESMCINVQQERMRSSKRECSVLFFDKLTVDIENSSVRHSEKPDQSYYLIKTPNNDRTRASKCQKKNQGDQFEIQLTQEFIKSRAEYGYKWGHLVQGSEGAIPSIRQIIEGIRLYVDYTINQNSDGQSEQRIRQRKLQNKRVFQKIIELVFPFDDLDGPLHCGYPAKGDNNLWNENGKVTSIIYWFYSLEPPLYAALNKACMTMDLELIEMLGPWARAISVNLSQSETEMNDLKDDNMFKLFTPSYYQLKNFCNSYLLFSCINMPEKQLKKFTEATDMPGSVYDFENRQWVHDQELCGHIFIKGAMSAFHDFRVALDNSIQHQKSSDGDEFEETAGKTVMLVTCVHNHDSDRQFQGFHMKKSQHSAHFTEMEVLLQEGIPFVVMGSETITIKKDAQDNIQPEDDGESPYLDCNDHYWRKHEGRTITVVYLFNSLIC